jgi:hypothetical protein
MLIEYDSKKSIHHDRRQAMSGHALLRCTVYTVIAAAAVSCGERTGPFAPALTRLDVPVSAARAESKAKVIKRSKALATDVVATATITPSGGTLSIPEAGLLVVFPRGAVTRNLVVTATANRGKEVVYSFEPHGTKFDQPIAIAQLSSLTTYEKKEGETQPDVHGGYLLQGPSDIDALGFATFSETFPAAFADGGGVTYVYFFTSHFSSYAMASGLLHVGVDLASLPILDR